MKIKICQFCSCLGHFKSEFVHNQKLEYPEAKKNEKEWERMCYESKRYFKLNSKFSKCESEDCFNEDGACHTIKFDFLTLLREIPIPKKYHKIFMYYIIKVLQENN